MNAGQNNESQPSTTRRGQLQNLLTNLNAEDCIKKSIMSSNMKEEGKFQTWTQISEQTKTEMYFITSNVAKSTEFMEITIFS